MFLSCLSPGWCGSEWWQCSLLVSPCALSLIVVISFTLFTDGCGCTVNWVLCLLCGWVFHCVVCGIARHLYCWSGVYYVEFLNYRGRTVLYALCMWLLVLSVCWCIVRCCMLPLLVCYVLVGKSLSVVLSWGGSLSFSRLGGVLLGAGCTCTGYSKFVCVCVYIHVYKHTYTDILYTV